MSISTGVDGATPEERLARMIAIGDRMGIERYCVYGGMTWIKDPPPETFRQFDDQVLQAVGKFPDQVLFNTLDPNREVALNFVGYTVETKGGRTLDGIITDETAASLTLKRTEGVAETVLRRDIVQLSGSGLSLMPEGVESAFTVEQMADLIAFLLLSK